jgi:hypothetical protein
MKQITIDDVPVNRIGDMCRCDVRIGDTGWILLEMGITDDEFRRHVCLKMSDNFKRLCE